MFNSNLTPEERVSEYNLLGEEISVLRRHLYASLLTLRLHSVTDTKEMLSLYKQRRSALKENMLKACKRCYGTGSPLGVRIDLVSYSHYCTDCGKPNRD